MIIQPKCNKNIVDFLLMLLFFTFPKQGTVNPIQIKI